MFAQEGNVSEFLDERALGWQMYTLHKGSGVELDMGLLGTDSFSLERKCHLVDFFSFSPIKSHQINVYPFVYRK